MSPSTDAVRQPIVRPRWPARAADVLEDEIGVDLTDELLAASFQDGHTERTVDRVLAEGGLLIDLVPALVTAYHEHDGSLFDCGRPLDQ